MNIYTSCSKVRNICHTQPSRKPQDKKIVSTIMDHNLNYLRLFDNVNMEIIRNMNCSYENAIKILFAWSLGVGVKELTEHFDIEENVIKYLYYQCTQYAKSYIRSNNDNWKIGGDNIVVIIDTYPDGCKKFNYDVSPSEDLILCIAEAKGIPTKYWFELLNGPNANEQLLQTICDVIRPNSTLVVDANSSICQRGNLEKLKNLYPIIVSLDELVRHDNNKQNVLDNLKTIWEPALQICESCAYHVDLSSFFTSYLWNQRFGNDGLKILLELFKN